MVLRERLGHHHNDDQAIHGGGNGGHGGESAPRLFDHDSSFRVVTVTVLQGFSAVGEGYWQYSDANDGGDEVGGHGDDDPWVGESVVAAEQEREGSGHKERDGECVEEHGAAALRVDGICIVTVDGFDAVVWCQERRSDDGKCDGHVHNHHKDVHMTMLRAEACIQWQFGLPARLGPFAFREWPQPDNCDR